MFVINVAQKMSSASIMVSEMAGRQVTSLRTNQQRPCFSAILITDPPPIDEKEKTHLEMIFK